VDFKPAVASYWFEATPRDRGDKAVNRRLRFRFSLATLLIAMAWSGGMVWMNVTPRVESSKGSETDERTVVAVLAYGWPCAYFSFFAWYTLPRQPRRESMKIDSPWALAGDVVVGVLLVAVLTWGSTQLLRRVTSRLRRGRLPPVSTS
jgi:hypothetical protein